MSIARVYESPELELSLGDDGSLDTIVDAYCDVCDKGETHRYSMESVDRVGGEPTDGWWERIEAELDDEHDCLLPLRQAAQVRIPDDRGDTTQLRATRTLAQLACRALGEGYA